MTKAEKVVWTEGMFLRPHHFSGLKVICSTMFVNGVRYSGHISGAFLTLNWMKRCFVRDALP